MIHPLEYLCDTYTEIVCEYGWYSILEDISHLVHFKTWALEMQKRELANEKSPTSEATQQATRPCCVALEERNTDDTQYRGVWGENPRLVWTASPQRQAKRGSNRGKRSAAVAGASEARQLQGQAKRGSCRGKWKLAQKSGNCPKKRVMF